MRALTPLFLFAALLPAASGPAAAADAPARFQSIELRGGGTVTVRYGATRRVNVRGGNPGARAIRADGDQLVIERCRERCPRGHRLEVEVVTPEISRLAVTDGGVIQLSGDFPAQPSVAASVFSGGMIDMRPLAATQISAAVSQGGRILARPLRAMNATISDGGAITYWGEAAVVSSVRRGGAVARGADADLRRPLAALDPALQAPPAPLPVLPVPPLPGSKKQG